MGSELLLQSKYLDKQYTFAMTYTKENIMELLSAHKETLSSFQVKRIGLFGSFQKKMNRDSSDIDLLVEFHPEQKTFKNYTGTYLFLKDVLQKDIDFLTPESLSPYIGPHILKDVEYVAISD